jgi:hypothetical protein
VSYVPFPNPPLPATGVGVAFQPAFQLPAFQSFYDFSQEFGWATVVPLAQAAVQPALPTYMAGSACRVKISFFDVDGEPFVPYQVQWRSDDWPSMENVLWWQNVQYPGITNTITVPARWNAMISYSREFETRQILFRIADWTGNVFDAYGRYDLLNNLGSTRVNSWGFQGAGGGSSGAFQPLGFQTGNSPANN